MLPIPKQATGTRASSFDMCDMLGGKMRALVLEHFSSGRRDVPGDGQIDFGKHAVLGICFCGVKLGDSASDAVGVSVSTENTEPPE